MTQPTSPLVSIIMPLYNAERFVSLALKSVLSQQKLAMEVIVVDDQSTDQSLCVVKQLRDDRIRVLTNAGRGIADALNTGLSAARGSILTRCDADDIYASNRLQHQVSWLNQHSSFAAVCGNYCIIDSQGSLVIQFDCGDHEDEITRELQTGKTRTHLCTFAIRTQVFKELGGFRSYFTSGEDIDFQLRLGDRFRVGYCPEVNYLYRIHRTSITHTTASTKREFFDDMAREFQQQRHLTGKDNLQRGCPPPVPDGKGIPYTAAEHIQVFLLGRAWQEFQQGKSQKAFSTSLQAALTYPQKLSVWRSLLALWIKSMRKQFPTQLGKPRDSG